MLHLNIFVNFVQFHSFFILLTANLNLSLILHPFSVNFMFGHITKGIFFFSSQLNACFDIEGTSSNEIKKLILDFIFPSCKSSKLTILKKNL